jgi:crotonobetainyl-CoA:carnitine CoA-transferase CaiB-like acyl-CoA transferase
MVVFSCRVVRVVRRGHIAAKAGGNEAMSYEAPYEGLKVVDLSQGVAGPYCAMMLAQYGADVIKVEPTDTGDWSRGLGTRYGDHTAYSIPANIGKRSIALDLKQEGGRAVLWRLIQGADVFVQGFRPGVIERLGFGYDAVAEREPMILYLSVSGFGQKGPLAERPAMDPVLQAYTGMMSENRGQDGIPHRIPFISIDMSTAIYSFGAIAAALHARPRQGRGRHIDASLMQAAAGVQVVRLMSSFLEDGAVRPGIPPSGVYRTKDGFISITVVRPWEWEAYCKAVDQPAFGADVALATPTGREPRAAELDAVLRPLIESDSSAAWSAKFSAHRVMHEALNSYPSFLKQPHVAESGAVAWTAHPFVPQNIPLPNIIGMAPFLDGTPRTVAPSKGEHGAAILAEHGYSPAEIDRLIATGVLGAA